MELRRTGLQEPLLLHAIDIERWLLDNCNLYNTVPSSINLSICQTDSLRARIFIDKSDVGSRVLKPAKT